MAKKTKIDYARQGAESFERRKKAGAYIKKLRNKVDGLTQREMAEKLGIDYFTFVSQVENGFARVPPAALNEWARELKVPLHEFATHLLKFYEPEMYKAIFSGPRK